jgi:acetyl esterase/lipase
MSEGVTPITKRFHHKGVCERYFLAIMPGWATGGTVKEQFVALGRRVMGILALLTAAVEACVPGYALNLVIPRAGYHVVRDLPYGNDPRQKLDLYVPDGLTTKAPVILFFFGGFWQSGSKELYLGFGQAFASEGIVVAVADYRLYPQVRYPDFVRDGAGAFAYLAAHVAQYGGDPERIFLAGHSAGAYIAAMLAVDSSWLREAHADPARVRGVIGISGPYNFLPIRDRNMIAIFGGADRPETQPIAHIDGKRPPMLLATGTADTTVLPRNTTDFAAKLKAFDSPVEVVTYSGVGHVGIMLSLAPGGNTTLRQDIVAFVRRESSAPR